MPTKPYITDTLSLDWKDEDDPSEPNPGQCAEAEDTGDLLVEAKMWETAPDVWDYYVSIRRSRIVDPLTFRREYDNVSYCEGISASPEQVIKDADAIGQLMYTNARRWRRLQG